MIKKLRKKFIILSTVSLLLLLGIIVISSNFLTYRRLVENADLVLGMLADSHPGHVPDADLMRPDMPRAEFGQKEADIPGAESGEEEADAPGAESGEEEADAPGAESGEEEADAPGAVPAPGKDGVHMGSHWPGRRFSPEIMYEARFFTVNMSREGMVTDINTERIIMVDQEDAAGYAALSFSRKKDRGFIGDFRFLKKYNENDIVILFLDCGRNLSTFKSALMINCLISFTGLLVIFAFIIIYSGKIVQPVSESYEKQKQFISVAGHEIKTPVTIIDADVEILSMEIGEGNEWLQDICVQTRRMTALTNDLLSLSRMDENRQQYHMIDFPISDVVSETVQSFQTLARSKGKCIRTRITPMLSYHGDEGGIRQITGILLDNAIKYAKEGADGSSSDIELSLEKKGHHIILSVKNSSEPVRDEQLQQFFDRFYRTEQSRDSEKGGYGLGLSIAKAIVEAHRGRIAAAAPAKDIVQITVTLPLKGQKGGS